MAVRYFAAVEDDFEGLVPRAIPQPQDRVIRDLLGGWSGLDVGARGEASRSISEWQHTALLGFSDRLASVAVRESDPEAIYLGLLALSVDDWRFDFRDCLVRVALHYDAAMRIDVDPASLFERAAAVVPPEAAAGLRSFLLRNPNDKSLTAFMHTAGEDEGGFRYLSDHRASDASAVDDKVDPKIRSEAVQEVVQIAIRQGNAVKHVSVSPWFRQFQTVWMADPLTPSVTTAIEAAKLGLAYEQSPTDDRYTSSSEDVEITFPRPTEAYRRYWGSVG